MIRYLHVSFIVLQISFVIPPDAVPGRMSLLITLLLCLINIFMNVISISPPSDSLNPIGIWLITCISFVILALSQYGCILFWKIISKHSTTNQKMLQKIDLISLGIVSLLFFIFNVSFWQITYFSKLQQF